MRIILSAVLLLSALPNLGAAQSSWLLRIDQQVAMEKLSTEVAENSTAITLNYQKSRLLGLTATYGRSKTSSESWGEATIGLSFALSEAFKISLGPGIEQYGGALRARINVDYHSEENQSFLYGEYDTGKVDPWYWIDLAVFVSPRIGFGMLAQMPDLGLGPKLEFRLGDHISLSTAGLWNPDEEKVRAAIGVRASFGRK